MHAPWRNCNHWRLDELPLLQLLADLPLLQLLCLPLLLDHLGFRLNQPARRPLCFLLLSQTPLAVVS